MRASDLDLIFVPEAELPDAGHWQTRWVAKLSSARFVMRGDVEAIVEAARQAKKPIFFIAHSTGAIAVAQAAEQLKDFDVRGAFFVAPPAAAALTTLQDGRFGALPTGPLPFPSVVVASRTDPWASYREVEDIALDWGADIIDAGEAGRLDEASGHGPWPEGLLRLAGMFRRL